MKTLTEYYLNNYNKLNKAKIGFEFEFYPTTSLTKLEEVFRIYFPDSKLYIMGKYHSDVELTPIDFKIEPDSSGGSDMVELITGVMDYDLAKITLMRICEILQKHASIQNYIPAIHINISFKDENDMNISMEKFNKLHFIVNFDEKKIMSNPVFNSENKKSGKSIKKLIPYTSIDLHALNNLNLNNNFINSPESKYFGVNFGKLLNGYLEFRYLGGENYQFKSSHILSMLDYFTLSVYNSLNAVMSEFDIVKLKHILNERIELINSFHTYDAFLLNFDNINLYVDKQNDYNIIQMFYPVIREKLEEILLNSTINDDMMIINYDTTNSKVEIVEGKITFNVDMVTNINFVRCEVSGVWFDNCVFYDTIVSESYIEDSTIYMSDIKNSKLISSDIDKHTTLENCWFGGRGRMMGTMKGGVFKGGIIGDTTFIGEDVIVDDKHNGAFGYLMKDKKDAKDGSYINNATNFETDKKDKN